MNFKYLILVFLIFSLFFGQGCTKKSNRVDKLMMLKMAQEFDPSVKPILPKDMNSGLKCLKESGELNYGVGCMGAFQVLVGKLEMGVIEFESEEQAKEAARNIDQYYYRNWLFDDVRNEPTLEYFVKGAFKAERP